MSDQEELYRILGKLEAGQQALLDTVNKGFEQSNGRLNDHAGRLRILEMWKAGLAMVWTASVALAGYLHLNGKK